MRVQRLTCTLSERTYRSHFQRVFGFEWLNQRRIEQAKTPAGAQIAVVHCTFLQKTDAGLSAQCDRHFIGCVADASWNNLGSKT